MTKYEALWQFFSSFGMAAYEENAVPVYSDTAQTSEIRPPYITYQAADSDFWGGPVAISADIWDNSDSLALCEDTARAISAAVLPFQKLVCDDGYILVTKGSPFSQPVPDDDFKRVSLNFWLTFVTN